MKIKEFQKSSKKTLGWVLLRDKHPSEQEVPAWSSFNQILESEQNFLQANVGYFPPITAPPTQMNVIYEVINQTFSIKKKLGHTYIFLEDDQAIFAKVLDVMFMENENNKIFDKIIVRMVGFHIIICLLSTIYSCFRNTGLVELLSRVGLGGKGTIQNAVKGGDVKYGIYLHKLLFEAIARSKIHHAIKTDEVFSEKNR